MANITVSEARKSDLLSLGTIVARSFHPVNPYIKQCFPNTPAMRKWWSHIFEEEANSESCHVLVALDNTTDKDVGILTLRLLGADDRGAGLYTLYELTDDHDREMFEPMIAPMIEHRERLMLGRSHYLIELFGSDDKCKGRGVGTKLLSRACEIADKAGYDIFVQANASAKDFYGKLGFCVEFKAVMPGGEYTEYLMVRRIKATEG